VDPFGLYVWRYRYYPGNGLSSQRSKKISPSGRELRFYYDGGILLNEEGWFKRTPSASGCTPPANGYSLSADGYKLPVGSEQDRMTHIVSWFYGAESSPIGIDTTPPHSGPNEKCINYYITDENNSITALIDPLGNILKTYEYDYFGNRIETQSESDSPNPHTSYNPLGIAGNYIDMVSRQYPPGVGPGMPPGSPGEDFRKELNTWAYYVMKQSGYEGKMMCFNYSYIVGHSAFRKYIRQYGYTIIKSEIQGYKPHQPESGYAHFGVMFLVRCPDGQNRTFYTDFRSFFNCNIVEQCTSWSEHQGGSGKIVDDDCKDASGGEGGTLDSWLDEYEKSCNL